MRQLLLAVLFAGVANAAVVFETNFDAEDDWTVTQPTASDGSCWAGSCGPWTGYYNGRSYCDPAMNNNFYIDAIPGYPTEESGTCYGGSGKCVTFWSEACTTTFVNSDGQFIKDLGQEYSTLYLRFKIRFQTGWTWAADTGGNEYPQHKLFHIQHFQDPNPWQYFGANLGNQPVGSGGIQVDVTGQAVGLYSGTRSYCGPDGANYSCYYPYNANIVPDYTWVSGTTDASGKDQLDVTGDYFKRYPYETWGSGTGRFGDGNWHTIEVMHKSNTWSGSDWNADGELKYWVDGVLQISRANVPWNVCDNSSNCAESSPVRGWRVISIGGNTNNYFSAGAEQWYAIDEVVVSTTYVGTDYTIGGSASIGGGAGSVNIGGGAGTLTFE